MMKLLYEIQINFFLSLSVFTQLIIIFCFACGIYFYKYIFFIPIYFSTIIIIDDDDDGND